MVVAFAQPHSHHILPYSFCSCLVQEIQSNGKTKMSKKNQTVHHGLRTQFMILLYFWGIAVHFDIIRNIQIMLETLEIKYQN